MPTPAFFSADQHTTSLRMNVINELKALARRLSEATCLDDILERDLKSLFKLVRQRESVYREIFDKEFQSIFAQAFTAQLRKLDIVDNDWAACIVDNFLTLVRSLIPPATNLLLDVQVYRVSALLSAYKASNRMSEYCGEAMRIWFLSLDVVSGYILSAHQHSEAEGNQPQSRWAIGF